MKKPVKITLVSLGSVLAILLIAITIAVWFVFTPQRLTPIVRDILQKNIRCQSQLDEVELTFFSTFPNFNIKINQFTLTNHIQGSKSDTLLHINCLKGEVNPIKYLFDNELIINSISLEKGFVNLYTDSTGRSNFDVFATDSTQKDTTEFKMPFDFLELHKMSLADVRIDYCDKQSGINTQINNLGLSLVATINQSNGDINLNADAQGIAFEMDDSTRLETAMEALSFNLKGNKNNNKINGNVRLGISALDVFYGNSAFVAKQNLSVDLPLGIDIKDFILNLGKGGFIEFANQKIALSGWLSKQKQAIDMDVKIETDMLQMQDIMALMPDNIKKNFSKMTFDGRFDLAARVKGKMHGDTIPKILADINIENAKYSQKGLPWAFRNINGQLQATIDDKVSDLKINRLKLSFGKSSVVANGSINDLTGRQMCHIALNGNLDFDDLKSYLPQTTVIQGDAVAKLKGAFTFDDIAEVRMKKIKLNGNIDTKNLTIRYNDSTVIEAPRANIAVSIPSTRKNPKFKELIEVGIDRPARLDFEQIGTLKARVHSPKINLGISDVTDSRQPMSVRCSYNIPMLDVEKDTIVAKVTNPHGDFYMVPSKHNSTLSTYIIALVSSQLDVEYGKDVKVTSSKVDLNGNITYDNTQANAFLQFLPYCNMKMNDIGVETKELKEKVRMPIVDFSLTPDNLTINKSRFILKNSDFNLSGKITNIDDYMRNDGMLKADLSFTSDMVNIKELMDIVSGFGAKDSVQKEALAEKAKDGDKDPFMVPWNIDMVLNTNVSHGKIFETDIYDLGGKLMIKDGVLVLEQMGFTCEAAKMQLTSIYRSERKNHLFVGLDFHLLDIEVDKLIKMIPQIDTIVPMLRYFSGKGEFHIAAETYLKSNYDIKYSTLRGASAIEGKNLVLLDNKTFDKMAKMLMFKKKTRNVVDSLSVELTVFRDEVELYPFLFSMDNYQVVLQGIYNLSQNYKIKAEAISPIKLGVDLTSNKTGGLRLSKLKLLNLKYSNMFKPEKQNATQRQILELKKMISDALKANVKKQ
jgi:hypothetical protein